MHNSLTESDKKRLRDSHPLYRRLSGDAVWELLSDNGMNDVQCGGILDALVADMHRVISVMHQIEQRSADQQETWIGFRLSGALVSVLQQKGVTQASAGETQYGLCSACKALQGLSLCAHPDNWQKVLPPFGLGCQVIPYVIAEDELKRGLVKQVTMADILLPQHTLMCHSLMLG